jgi:hypothetical protein
VAADRNDTRLAALAGDTHRGIGEIDVFGSETGQFGQTQAGGIKQFEHRAVAHRQRIVVTDFDQLLRIIRRQRIGQALGAFRCADADAGVLRAAMIACEIVIKTAPGREHACEAAAVQPATVELGNGAADVVRGQFRRRRIAGNQQQGRDVAMVVFGSVCGQPALMRQVFDVPLQQFLRGPGNGNRRRRRLFAPAGGHAGSR